LNIEFVAFDSRIDIYTQIYGSTHFYTNVSKHITLYSKSVYLQNTVILIDKCPNLVFDMRWTSRKPIK